MLSASRARGALRPVLGRSSALQQQVRHCGLVATLQRRKTQPFDRCETGVIGTACERLHHRGPDGSGQLLGHWRGSDGSDGSEWALGHTRLAIVAPDETSANQPFSLGTTPSCVADVSMVANGEVYAHKAIFDTLVAEHGYPADARRSGSDCEVIAHAYRALGSAGALRALESAGMFAFVLIDHRADAADGALVAARDPTGIKPLYYGVDETGAPVAFASELKALVGVVPGLVQIHEFPAGHYYTPASGFVRYYKPAWQHYAQTPALGSDVVAPWEGGGSGGGHVEPGVEEVRQSLDDAVWKRMMSDVKFGMFLSGGIDSCIIGQLMLAHCRAHLGPEHHSPPSFTVGMADSPDLMAAREMARLLGTTHHEKIFTTDEAIGVIEDVVYHMETYNAELIRSAVPNYFLAQLAKEHGVKMVLTGEGADELWGGYAYFQDAPSAGAVHRELVRIYNHLGVANLLRTDRMTMAHGVEARVPFLDTLNTALTMGVHPRRKLFDAARFAETGEPGEKAYLRRAFERTHGGVTISQPLLWRAKAMQCEGVGEDWVSQLQAAVSARVTDAQLADAPTRFPHNTPVTKEEYYYRHLFDSHYPGCDAVPTLWNGGCRAGGAEWDSASYTREGLADVSRLTHSLQGKYAQEAAA